MRVLITKPHTIVTLRNKRGTPRAMISFAPSDRPITVKREHGEELISAKAATEVSEPASRGGPVTGKLDNTERGAEHFTPASDAE